MGHLAEAERDASAVEPDDHGNALPGNMRGSGFEGCVGSDEVDDGSEEALCLPGGNREVGAELVEEGF